jgi:hypothetical protein
MLPRIECGPGTHAGLNHPTVYHRVFTAHMQRAKRSVYITSADDANLPIMGQNYQLSYNVVNLYPLFEK